MTEIHTQKLLEMRICRINREWAAVNLNNDVKSVSGIINAVLWRKCRFVFPHLASVSNAAADWWICENIPMLVVYKSESVRLEMLETFSFILRPVEFRNPDPFANQILFDMAAVEGKSQQEFQQSANFTLVLNENVQILFKQLVIG